MFNPKSDAFLQMACIFFLVFSSCGGGKGTDESLPAGEPSTPKSDTAQVWVAPESTHRVMNPQSASVASIEKGKSIYLQYCVTCHGADGKQKFPRA